MVSKRDPNKAIDAFKDEADRLERLWTDTQHALIAAPRRSRAHRDRLAKEACTDAFIRLAVAFEGFRSEWHITAIHKKSGTFRKALEERIIARLADNHQTKAALPHVEVRLPRSLTLAQVRSLVDPLGRNVTLKPLGKSKASWIRRAEGELEDPYAGKVTSLTAADWRLMHAVEAIRNHLAHRSEDSVNVMNAALTALDRNRDGPLRVTGAQMIRADGVSRYLWALAYGSKGPCRLVLYYDRLGKIASALRFP